MQTGRLAQDDGTPAAVEIRISLPGKVRSGSFTEAFLARLLALAGDATDARLTTELAKLSKATSAPLTFSSFRNKSKSRK
jgi:hypothetical protein